MELLVKAGAALWCEGREDGNSSPPWAHDKISSPTLFAKVEYRANLLACVHVLLFLQTVLFFIVQEV